VEVNRRSGKLEADVKKRGEDKGLVWGARKKDKSTLRKKKGKVRGCWMNV